MLIVIPFHKEDAEMADRLCDMIYWQRQESSGNCLLVAAPDVHPEMKLKVKLSAEVAFKTVDMLELAGLSGVSKSSKINDLFRQAARYICDCYKDEWLWLEPDCIPTKPDWRELIESAYRSQAKRYIGRFMQASAGVFLSRIAVYPRDAANDLEHFCKGEPPFERVAKMTPRASQTLLINMAKHSMDSPLPPDAAIVAGDKSGALLESLIESASEPEIPNNTLAKRRGRPPKIIA